MTAGISGYTSSFKFKRIEFDWPRWHDPMNSNWDRLDSILNTYIASNGITGDWANSVEYLVADKVFDSVEGNLYICKVAHTSASSGSFVDDIAAHPSYWAPYNFVPVPKGEWQTSTTYDAGAFVYLGAIFAYCVVPHTSDVFADDITAGYWAILIDADATVTSAESAKNAAAASASSAAASESAALAYKVAAAASETNAADSSGAASTSATNASASASAAHTSAEDASSAKTAAELARDEAEGYAVAADNTPSAILSKLRTIAVPFGTIRNRHLNSAFQICQDRATGATTVVTAAAYAFDGVAVNAIGGAALTCAQVVKATPGGSPYRLRATVTTTDTTISGSDYVGLAFPIEGVDVADLRFGTASARSFVWRGVVTAPAGTYHLAFRNHASTRSYMVPVVVTAGEAGTDKLVTAVVPGDTSGVWISDASGVGIRASLTLAAGGDYLAPATGAWQAGNYIAAAGQSNGVATVGAVYEICDIGLYAGTELPAWEMPAYADDLRKCQRYFETSYPAGNYPGGGATTVYGGVAVSASDLASLGVVSFVVPKRATPAMIGYSSDGTPGVWFCANLGANSGNIGFAVATTAGFRAYCSNAAFVNNYVYLASWVASARL